MALDEVARKRIESATDEALQEMLAARADYLPEACALAEKLIADRGGVEAAQRRIAESKKQEAEEAERRQVTERHKAEERKIYRCPKCGGELDLTDSSNKGPSKSLVGAAMKASVDILSASFHCKTCGPIKTEELSPEDQKKWAGEKTAASGCLVICVVGIILLLLLFGLVVSR